MSVRALFLLIILYIGLAAPVSARVDFDYGAIDPQQKIHDLADLMTSDERQTLENAAEKIVASFRIDVAVITVDRNPGTAQTLADDLYDYSGFGCGSGDDGLLLLIDMDNREAWISTYGRAASLFSDRTIDSLLDAVADALAQGDYAGAGDIFLSRVEAVCRSEEAFPTGEGYVGPNGEEPESPESEKPVTPAGWAVRLLGALAVAAVIALIRVGCLIKEHRPVKIAAVAADYALPDSFRLTRAEDRFISTHTSRQPLPKETHHTGGGKSGGGSSHHTSSSGRSHGGGGRKF